MKIKPFRFQILLDNYHENLLAVEGRARTLEGELTNLLQGNRDAEIASARRALKKALKKTSRDRSLIAAEICK